MKNKKQGRGELIWRYLQRHKMCKQEDVPAKHRNDNLTKPVKKNDRYGN